MIYRSYPAIVVLGRPPPTFLTAVPVVWNAFQAREMTILLIPNSAATLVTENKVNVVHIESRKSRKRPSQYEIYVDVQCEQSQINDLLHNLEHEVECVSLEQFEKGEVQISDHPPPTPTSPGLELS
ncbi:tryptophan 5-hydroxylase 1 [Trichonephila clavipes]|nr:tryptophan 5-hydroxylase 1 [Trichonephila clavipes]